MSKETSRKQIIGKMSNILSVH